MQLTGAPQPTEPPAAAAARLRAERIGKSFGPVHALADVSLDVRAGEVLALVGENGAGKSTLLRVLSGDHAPDSGRLLLDGEPVAFGSPRDAHRAGLRVIQQEPEIVPHVSVAENVYLGALPRRGRVLDKRTLLGQVRADIERHGFSGLLDPRTLGSDLSPAQRQLVEILRALVGEVRVIAFDEPTSSLSDHEVEALFGLIRRLRDGGVAIVYVSHRMPEIFTIADRVAVLRDGRYVGDRRISQTNEGELVRMMVGRDLADMFVRDPREPGEVVLRVHGLTTDDVRDIDLEVRAGEVVGLGGLVGAGRSELALAVAGAVPLRAGTVEVAGKPVRLHGPADALRAGIGFAPEERKAQALLLRRSIRDNVSLAILTRITRLRVVRRGAERDLARRYVKQLSVRASSIEQEVGTLSGGNQQKVVLARWLARRPRVLILDEPTRGVDVGAKAEIYSIVNDLAAEGMALLVISSELPELLGLSDRIVVMHGGRVSGRLSRADATEERVLALAMSENSTAASATAENATGTGATT
ncbi:MAG TPA: sugar ABC transporter ATP-binding protein [Actinocrinis sp.]|uniref:sugar ABC transporter ATP-binding protein n=1 Tax=Actinocrinis sp. TaxID=1920516 RepID=UPI002DDD13C0|nr:sugar ABC transporter ATP-binding protein [Actinocrinis sp.]HEV3173863.1 sugar ABC transporter ATP-binding protein [Actinocrinis sp.]